MDRKIPFVKPARVGNYKLWRTKTTVGKGKDKDNVEQICVSDLEGVWQVRIPETIGMFAAISLMYADESMEPSLSTVFTNLLVASSIPNGYFHRAVQMCSTVYFNPDLLRDRKQRKSLIKEAKALVKDFLIWADAYKAEAMANAPSEDQDRQEEMLEDMLDEIDSREP